MKMYRLVISLIILFCLPNLAQISQGQINVEQDSISKAIPFPTMLDTIQYRSFLYFLNEVNKDNGLVRDRSAGYSPASIAAVGFALPCYGIAVERGWMSRADALHITTNLLRFLLNSGQTAKPATTGYKGLYYHFLDMKNGKREWNSELSTIDTGLLFAGIIFARQYFNLDTPEEIELRKMAAQVMERAEWAAFIKGGSDKFTNTLALGWSPEEGMHQMGWIGYNEALILYVIAGGSGMKNVDKAYDAWLATYDWREPYKGMPFVSFPPLFGHQYSSCFLDLRGIADKYMMEKGFDYFENSRRAIVVQRRYAMENPKGWKGYDSLCWGLTACDGPGDKFNANGKEYLGYAGRGTSGTDLTFFDDGTIAPTAAVSSIVFAPELVLPTIENFYNNLGSKGLWGKYGFVDAFNLTAGWYDKDYLGIDQGPIVIMLENYRTGFVWKTIMKDPIIKNGLKSLGFAPLALKP